MSTARVGWRLCLEQGPRVLSSSLIRASGPIDDPEYAVWTTMNSTPGALIQLATGLVPAGGDIWDGPLCDPQREREVVRQLGHALLPQPLREALAAPDGARHTLTVAARGWCSALPWEALALGEDDTRLVERCHLRTEAHPLADRGITRAASSWAEGPGPEADGLVVLDPGPLVGDDPATAPLYPAGPPAELTTLGGPRDVHLPTHESLSTDGLAEALSRRSWRRLLYAGHVRPGTTSQPGNTALVLSDGLEVDPLSAYAWLGDPGRWPAPARVALLGCSSGDARTVEDVGLLLAALRAGAETVTATRWNLPTDLSADERPFTELVRAVHAAHLTQDPAARLRDWQITELHRWRVTGARQHSPMIWAALSTTDLCPPGAA